MKYFWAGRATAELAEDKLEYVKEVEEYELVVLADVREEEESLELLELEVLELVLLASMTVLARIKPALKTNPIKFI